MFLLQYFHILLQIFFRCQSTNEHLKPLHFLMEKLLLDSSMMAPILVFTAFYQLIYS